MDGHNRDQLLRGDYRADHHSIMQGPSSPALKTHPSIRPVYCIQGDQILKNRVLKYEHYGKILDPGQKWATGRVYFGFFNGPKIRVFIG